MTNFLDLQTISFYISYIFHLEFNLSQKHLYEYHEEFANTILPVGDKKYSVMDVLQAESDFYDALHKSYPIIMLGIDVYAALLAKPQKPALRKIARTLRNTASRPFTSTLISQYEANCERETFINGYRLLLIETLLRKHTAPAPVSPIAGLHRRGRSEEYFYSMLKIHFKEQVHISRGIQRGKYLPYIPDFTLWLKEVNLVIDIEIDEPYSADGQPIHYIGNKKDIDRDFYFLQNRWIVIRFTEGQVVEQPEECIALIQDIVISLTKNTFHQFHSKLKKVSKWTKEESRALLEQDFRSTYLNLLEG